MIMGHVDILSGIYEKLQDLPSKSIFLNRLMFNISNEDVYLREIIKESEWERSFCEILDSFEGKELVIFGAGDYGRRLVRFFPEYEWKFFADNNIQEGILIHGIPVISKNTLISKHKSSIVVISPIAVGNDIKEDLMKSGFDENRIIVLNDYLQNLTQSIYFDLEKLQHSENELFVDCGALDGSTTLSFCKWAKNNGSYRAVLFEPNTEMIDSISTIIDNECDYKLINKGLWNCETTLYYNRSEIVGEGYVSEVKKDNYSIPIPVTSIDSELSGESVTFIKMDIEGSEIAAIKGAKETIKRCNPKLAVSVYHRPDDIWAIPNLILSYNPEYKLYLRHYTMGPCDTVLYAI